MLRCCWAKLETTSAGSGFSRLLNMSGRRFGRSSGRNSKSQFRRPSDTDDSYSGHKRHGHASSQDSQPGRFHRGNTNRKPWHQENTNQKFEHSAYSQSNEHSNRPRPRGGRALGLWYAERSRAKKKGMEKKQCSVVRMNNAQMSAACYALDQMEQASLSTSEQAKSHDRYHKDLCAEASVYEHASESGGELQGNSRLDEELFNDFARNSKSESYQKMLQFRKKLPAYKMKQDLVDLINSNQVVVISGETGCGKTTQVPQFILDDAINRGVGSTCRIVCTQPRRISAISVGQRVAAERAESCGSGSSCGYQIRLEKRLPRDRGSILYCTTGILIQVRTAREPELICYCCASLPRKHSPQNRVAPCSYLSDKWLQTDSLLSSVSHVILDEIHERDLNSDFLITIIKNLLERRQSLKVILMSATLNADLFSAYFSNCPKINIPGFTFPVKEYYLEKIVQMLNYKPTNEAHFSMDRLLRRKIDHRAMRGASKTEKQSALEDRMTYLDELQDYEVSLRQSYPEKLCQDICTMDAHLQKKVDTDLVLSLIKHIIRHPFSDEDDGGAMLIFLPGWEEIKQINEAIKKDRGFFHPDKFNVIPLHSLMPSPDQRKVFDRPPPGVTKLVLATNIAETSITIDDIVYVIDCGKMKVRKFEHGKNLETLAPDWLTRANARQRRGRAGRVQDGYCFHLFTGLQESKLEDFMVPEILRIRLDQVCLQIKLLKLGSLKTFLSQVLEPPTPDAIDLSIEQLTALNALDSDERLTPLGYHLAKLPVPPSIGKMLLFGAMFKCLDPILTVAASLSFKAPFVIPLGKEEIADSRRKELAGDSNSDHLMLVKAYSGWLKAQAQGRASQYCWYNFMSPTVLKMIKDMRGQFVEHLRESGFLLSRDPSDWNSHSSDDKIVLAVVCAGLYPNVAKLSKMNPRKPPKISGKTERRLAVHPKSVNSSRPSERFKQQWLCYYEKMKTAEVYLYDTSEISPYPLLFFGGNVRAFKEEGENKIAVDDWIQFKAHPDVAETVRALRDELDKILERKIKKPYEPFKQADLSVISAIIDLISNE